MVAVSIWSWRNPVEARGPGLFSGRWEWRRGKASGSIFEAAGKGPNAGERLSVGPNFFLRVQRCYIGRYWILRVGVQPVPETLARIFIYQRRSSWPEKVSSAESSPFPDDHSVETPCRCDCSDRARRYFLVTVLFPSCQFGPVRKLRLRILQSNCHIGSSFLPPRLHTYQRIRRYSRGAFRCLHSG